ncbi:MAG: hypothetical protein H7X88_06675 [Gloeobacteraceae cyanobacterium ES-bin-316]|nr:hypothetical protein [Ferruginibacter sp.]
MIFALNSSIGIACSLGLKLGKNVSHHSSEAAGSAKHIHKNGKHSHGDEAPVKPAEHRHADGKKHIHQTPVQSNTVDAESSKDSHKSPEDCCKDEVLKFQNLDKNTTQKIKLTIDVLPLVAVVHDYPSPLICDASDILEFSSTRYLFPPPPDIRIAIHRFQI